jgi:hypothetical protein
MTILQRGKIYNLLIQSGHPDLAKLYTIKNQLRWLFIRYILHQRYNKITILKYTFYYKLFAPTGIHYKRNGIFNIISEFNPFSKDEFGHFIRHCPCIEFEIQIFNWSVGFGAYKEHKGYEHETISFNNANKNKKYPI